MQAEPQFSWLREFAVPAFFTLFGAALGFIASQIRDGWKAKRAKMSFMRAIGMELDALRAQLDSSLNEVTGSAARVAAGVGPHFAGTLRTSVFTNQVGKLRDVDDPLTIEAIHFYSDLGTLEQVFESVNELGDEYATAHVPSGQKDIARARLNSGLTVLGEQILAFCGRLKTLRAKLPRTDQPN